MVLVAVCALALAEALAGGRLLADTGVLLVAAAALAAGVWSRTVPTCAAVLVGAALMTVTSQVTDPGDYAVADDAVFWIVVLGCPALVGAGWAARGRQVRELRRLSVVRAAQLASEVEAARIAETTRVAARVQEDVVQTLGAILVLAEGAAGAGPDERGATQQAALVEIERSARHALDQLREHIGWLRGGPAPGRGPASPDQDGSRPERAVGAVPVVTGPAPRPGTGAIDLLAALAAVGVSVEVAVTGHAFGPTWAAVLAPLALTWPLAQRRRRPLVAVVTFFAVTLVVSHLLVRLDDMVTPILPMVLVGFAAGAYVRSWTGRLTAALLLATGSAAVAATDPAGIDRESLTATLVVLALAAAAGTVAAASLARVQVLDDLLRTIERHRDDEVTLATARQRQAIARDLHDTVASAATIICLQAGAAQTVPAQDPVVHEALQTIASTARQAVREIRISLDLVDRAAAAGTPGGSGAGGVQEVVATARRTGVDAQLRTPVPPLPASTEELVVRVVRETVVNASRYAPGAHVVVAVHRDGDDVLVRVSDDGPGLACAPAAWSRGGTGTGLAGLTERLTLHGGTLTHGPLGARGYEVRARLPVPAAEGAAAAHAGLAVTS
ncbi:hypothetical protein DV701_16585 [Ornithinimicrobium avium]|uniref:histidine kinase n=1 Tax=Ornithinimicrobium avium TaxID=2283195 RepID=A0A345NR52_9MICO|nr:hypothetical protein DV701_16585 [Ornithinimicrobium avium]